MSLSAAAPSPAASATQPSGTNTSPLPAVTDVRTFIPSPRDAGHVRLPYWLASGSSPCFLSTSEPVPVCLKRFSGRWRQISPRSKTQGSETRAHVSRALGWAQHRTILDYPRPPAKPPADRAAIRPTLSVEFRARLQEDAAAPMGPTVGPMSTRSLRHAISGSDSRAVILSPGSGAPLGAMPGAYAGQPPRKRWQAPMQATYAAACCHSPRERCQAPMQGRLCRGSFR